MAMLYLPMLAIFVAALVYFVALVVAELLSAAQRHQAEGPQQPQKAYRIAQNLRQATQEISAIFGLGDD